MCIMQIPNGIFIIYVFFKAYFFTAENRFIVFLIVRLANNSIFIVFQTGINIIPNFEIVYEIRPEIQNADVWAFG